MHYFSQELYKAYFIHKAELLPNDRQKTLLPINHHREIIGFLERGVGLTDFRQQRADTTMMIVSDLKILRLLSNPQLGVGLPSESLIVNHHHATIAVPESIAQQVVFHLDCDVIISQYWLSQTSGYCNQYLILKLGKSLQLGKNDIGSKLCSPQYIRMTWVVRLYNHQSLWPAKNPSLHNNFSWQ